MNTYYNISLRDGAILVRPRMRLAGLAPYYVTLICPHLEISRRC